MKFQAEQLEFAFVQTTISLGIKSAETLKLCRWNYWKGFQCLKANQKERARKHFKIARALERLIKS
jgi:hypothetical protein